MSKEIYNKIVSDLIEKGVIIKNPSTLCIDGSINVGSNVSIGLNVIFEGNNSLGDNVTIESNCIIKNSTVDAGTNIKAFSLVESSVVGKNCIVGPYARIRPNTVLSTNVQIGNYVEVKSSKINSGCKINHLSFVGDAEIEKNVIIGAGTITCNFDGKNNNKTFIGESAFIGSGVKLIAPINIGKFALIGAGSTITDDVPKNMMSIARGRQIIIKKK